MLNDPIYWKLSYNSCIPNVSTLKLEHNLKLSLGEMRSAIGKEIAEHILRPGKIIPASNVRASCVHLLVILHRL